MVSRQTLCGNGLKQSFRGPVRTKRRDRRQPFGDALNCPASCSSVDVVEILEKKRKKLTLLEVTASGERDPDPPWAYRKIHVKYRLGGKGLTEKAVEQAIHLSQDKYCSVSATVRGVARITYDYEIVADE